jgi:hypothetical protein
LHGIGHGDAIHYHNEIAGTATENLIATRNGYVTASRAYRKLIPCGKQTAAKSSSNSAH